MRRKLKTKTLLTTLSLVSFAAVVYCLAAAAEQNDEDKKPARQIVVAFKYPRMEVEPDDTISMDLIVKNNGKKDEVVLLEVVEAPERCRARIEEYGDVIGGIFVGSGEQKTLSVEAEWRRKKGKEEEQESDSGEEQEKRFPPGKYNFVVKATTEDGLLSYTAKAEVTVRAAEEGEEEEDPVEIRCSYPNLRGSSDSEFSFSIDIYNNTDKDDMASLRAEAPEGWVVSFKPSYENKYIGSLKIDSNLSRSVDVEVKPPPDAKVGKYTIKVFAKLSKEEFEASRELTVDLTGTYRIKCGTPRELLSFIAYPGEEAVVSMYVLNDGSATQSEIKLQSFEPEKWEVKFEPEKIEKLEPGEMEQVKMLVTPAADAIVGDYAVTVRADGENAEDEVEFRVTVKAPTFWAWVGVGVIIAVFVLLTVMFRFLGRR